MAKLSSQSWLLIGEMMLQLLQLRPFMISSRTAFHSQSTIIATCMIFGVAQTTYKSCTDKPLILWAQLAHTKMLLRESRAHLSEHNLNSYLIE